MPTLFYLKIKYSEKNLVLVNYVASFRHPNSHNYVFVLTRFSTNLTHLIFNLKRYAPFYFVNIRFQDFSLYFCARFPALKLYTELGLFQRFYLYWTKVPIAFDWL